MWWNCGDTGNGEWNWIGNYSLPNELARSRELQRFRYRLRINALPTLPTLSSSVAYYQSSTYLQPHVLKLILVGMRDGASEKISAIFSAFISVDVRHIRNACTCTLYNALATSNWLWSCFHVPAFIHIATQKIRTKNQLGLERVYRCHVVFSICFFCWLSDIEISSIGYDLWVNVLVVTRNQNRLPERSSRFLMTNEMHDAHLEEVEIWTETDEKCEPPISHRPE